jgi:hypothetical protein
MFCRAQVKADRDEKMVCGEHPIAKQLHPWLHNLTYVFHRNLRTRTSILAQVPQIFFGKEYLVKIG